MSHELREGVQLSNIDIDVSGDVESLIWDSHISVKSITVREICGDMSMIPSWVEVLYSDGTKMMYNLRYIKSVTIKPDVLDEEAKP